MTQLAQVETPSRTLPLISARGLHRHHGQTHALRGVDVTIRRGEIVAIMGPSGSGKSTLLHCLAGVITPDEGHVQVSGTRVSDLDEDRRAEFRLTELGFVFQFGQLLPELSAEDNVALPLMLAGTRRAKAVERARVWLGRMGLEGLERRLPAEMSGGQAQRVALARALVNDPAVLFADEPTGALDSLTAEKVMTTLTELARGTGTTLVIVTHDARVASYSDREIFIRDGRVTNPDIEGDL
ncbi:macrolide ABC transporter ATP-binding protein [Tessaracoccus aquimaris]|uniref:Macrolide ABC transporter ATP-binding protein n=1 Tax=Tessaracoccus aquimaris TaxID=1332264 RepID=A0A1Q2CN29_9ACTN|nr:ABC transporter ATP-binding protein [Tessaracoccus aquimaris]AQP47517.1 macrolide ABC transporter ATP-binding protein [Tessaracoccus aquimaris]